MRDIAKVVDFGSTSVTIPYPAIVEPKYDGLRCKIVINLPGRTDKVRFYSREGASLDGSLGWLAPLFADAARRLGMVRGFFDSEAMLGVSLVTALGLLGDIERKDAKVAVFDYFDEDNPRQRQRDRKAALKRAFEAVDPAEGAFATEYHMAVDETDLRWLLSRSAKVGFEGIIVRDPDAEYGAFAAVQRQKVRNTSDLPIIGVVESTTNPGTLGALLVELPNGDTGRIGTGFKLDDRAELWTCREALRGRYAEISHLGWTERGQLREAAFVRLRLDKGVRRAA